MIKIELNLSIWELNNKKEVDWIEDLFYIHIEMKSDEWELALVFECGIKNTYLSIINMILFQQYNSIVDGV